MNAPPFPLNPQAGDQSGNWVWNGARWVASPTIGLRVVTQTFTQSGPYMPTPGLTSCQVECWGGGGGGGPVNSVNVMAEGGGGGGGSGGYSRKTLPAALVRGGVLVTVGQGGAGVTDTSTGDGTYSYNGGATVFGALCIANGGLGGQANTSVASWGEAGDGAPAGIGDIAVPGNPGIPGTSTTGTSGLIVAAGTGGAIMGGGARGPLCPSGVIILGINGSGPGAGGGGASINQLSDPNGAVGGAGAPGLCIVTETVVGDRDQPVTEWRPPLDVNLNVTQRPPWPPRPPGPWWPPGWPPGWQPGSPWPPGWGPQPPWQPFEGQTIEGQEFEAGAEPYSQDPQDPEDP